MSDQKTCRMHHKSSPLSSCTIPKRGQKTLPSNKKGTTPHLPNPPAILPSTKILKTAHSLILMIPNSIVFSGIFHHFLRGKVSHPPPPAYPPHPHVTSENPCASGPRLDSRWTGCGVMRKSKPHFRS